MKAAGVASHMPAGGGSSRPPVGRRSATSGDGAPRGEGWILGVGVFMGDAPRSERVRRPMAFGVENQPRIWGQKAFRALQKLTLRVGCSPSCPLHPGWGGRCVFAPIPSRWRRVIKGAVLPG